MKLTQIDLAEGRGGSQREVSASEAVARAEEACGGTLLLFEPDGAPRAAVAICPGGGFGKVNTEHEGVAFAEWFVAHGIAAGVVKYRLPEGDPALPQQDVERAAELLRNRFGGVKTGVLGASIGGYLAARHLLSLGHRRIACVVGPHATQMDSEARYHGYCRAMEEAGIPVDERLRRRAARRQSNSSFHRILRRFSPATMLQRMAYAENSRNIERKCRKMFRSSDTMTFSMPGCWRCR